MGVLLNIVLVMTLLAVTYQDLKMRLIHVLLPVLLVVLSIALKWDALNFSEMGKSFSFLLLNLVVITIYFSIKEKTLVNPFDTLLGWGDVLFLIAVLPLFSFRSYLLFFVMGMLFSLVLYSVVSKIFVVQKTIPLAGYLSIFIIGVLGINALTKNGFLL